MRYSIVRKLDNSESSLVQQIVDRIKKITAAVQWEYVESHAVSELIIAVGGDGTVLYGMGQSALYDIPVFGFNIGKLGYLAEFQPEVIEETIIKIVHNEFQIIPRTILAEVNTNTIAINEFAIVPAQSKDTLKYEFFVDCVSSGKHHANGLLVSTPTGSTAYSLSVGGAILAPDAPVFQIAPVAAMSLNSRSVVVSDSSSVCVSVNLRKDVTYNLVADGQIVSSFNYLNSTDPDGMFKRLEFRKSQRTAKLLHSNDWNFFDVLQEKLHWNTIV
jgi:NAD+ kinase